VGDSLKNKIVFSSVIGIFLILSASYSSRARASEDAATKEALDKTVELMNDRSQREKAAKENTSAAAAHAEVQKLGGAQTQDAVYGVGAEIMKSLVQQTGGDPVKMQELMAKAQRDPEGFAKSLSPDQQAKIRSIASEVSAANNKK
jgi:flagellum-specific peptidoglycan hydrolase FlgJ